MRTDAVIIRKMLKYCDDATKYVSGMEYEAFIGNELYLTFTAFALSQLGEMASRFDDSFYERYPQVPWRAMRGMRNRIVHNYDGVQFATLWDVLTHDIPPLRVQLKEILGHVDSE